MSSAAPCLVSCSLAALCSDWSWAAVAAVADVGTRSSKQRLPGVERRRDLALNVGVPLRWTERVHLPPRAQVEQQRDRRDEEGEDAEPALEQCVVLVVAQERRAAVAAKRPLVRLVDHPEEPAVVFVNRHVRCRRRPAELAYKGLPGLSHRHRPHAPHWCAATLP